MNILYLSQLIPYPPDAGPKVRIWHVLQYLAAAGHRVTLLAFCRPDDSAENIAHLRQVVDELLTVEMRRSPVRDAWHLGRSFFSKEPFLIGRDNVAAMRRQLGDCLAQNTFDAIHVDQLWMAQYGLLGKSLAPTRGAPRTILDQHNAVHLIPGRLAAGTTNRLKRALLKLEAQKMAAYEIETCRQFDQVVWVTDEDRRAVAAAGGQDGSLAGGLTIPICVDPLAKPVIERRHHPRRVTFLGGLHWPPNAEGVLWFARKVWPHVQRAVPDACFTVIGKSPPKELAHTSPAGLDITGYVADPAPYLAETAAFIVPLHAGGGMRVKILDAWSWGMPVVSTAIGAEGIRYQEGEDLLIADSPRPFAEAVIRLLNEPEWGTRLAMNGRRTVEEAYDWRKVYPGWDEIYDRAS